MFNTYQKSCLAKLLLLPLTIYPRIQSDCILVMENKKTIVKPHSALPILVACNLTYMCAHPNPTKHSLVARGMPNSILPTDREITSAILLVDIGHFFCFRL